MAKSLYIRPASEPEFGLPKDTWNGQARLDQNHVGRFIFEPSTTFDPSNTARQIFGQLTWRPYTKDGKKLLKEAHTVKVYRTVYPDGYKQLKSEILAVGEQNHIVKLTYRKDEPEKGLPACLTYKLETSARSTNVSTATLEV